MRRAACVLVLAACGAPEAPEPRPPGLAESDLDLVDVAPLVPDAIVDMRYATADNFTGKQLYPVARCKLRRSVAVRLVEAVQALRREHRRLVLWDCYRPSSIQELMWKLVPDERYVANPRKGSRHGRGAAVDVALADEGGRLLVMPTAFDEFSAAAHRDRALASEKGAEARLLDTAMTAAGWVGLPTEWWHFDAPDATKYPLSDEPL
jgi:D-alanyl-D-alanine dipeptidase